MTAATVKKIVNRFETASEQDNFVSLVKRNDNGSTSPATLLSATTRTMWKGYGSIGNLFCSDNFNENAGADDKGSGLCLNDDRGAPGAVFWLKKDGTLSVAYKDSTPAPVCCGTVNGTTVAPSSEKIKKNILDYVGALDKIAALNVYEYDRKDIDLHEIGLIAEDESTPSELVEFNETTEPPTEEGGEPVVKRTAGIKTYSLLCMMIQAFKELKAYRDAEITAAQMALAESYEEMQRKETEMQLALCEAYESMLNGANA